MGGMERIKGERSERKSDRAETHDHYRLYMGRFGVEKVRFVVKMFRVDLHNCVSCRGGGGTFAEKS